MHFTNIFLKVGCWFVTYIFGKVVAYPKSSHQHKTENLFLRAKNWSKIGQKLANFWVRNFLIWFLKSWENFEWNFGAILCWLFSDLTRSFRGQWGHLTTKSVSCQNFIQNNARNMKIKFLDYKGNELGKMVKILIWMWK